jgi:sec-independent protein translocase protein TatC
MPRRLAHGEEATLVEHLGELRARLIIVLGALTVAFVVMYVFHGHILEWLNRPLPARLSKPTTFGVLEPFTTSIMVSFYAAIVVTLPLIFWQVWAFLAPAFDERHQRSMGVLVGFAAALALAGVAFGYWVILPAAVGFLTGYDSSHFNILVRARDYYSFTSMLLLAVALAFEVPVFMLGLVRLRILSAASIRQNWRMGVFAITVLGVLLPGVDPVSTTLSVLVLMSLYALSIGLASFFEPRWQTSRGDRPYLWREGEG